MFRRKKPAKKSNTNQTSDKKYKNAPGAVKKNKNVSKNIPIGTTLQTRDEYFAGRKNYRKPGYENNKKKYRKAAVIDTNRKDEVAVVVLTTSEKGTALPNYQKGQSKYRPFIKTKDDDNMPIKLGDKFERNRRRENLSKHDVDIIKEHALKRVSKSLAKENKSKLRELKNRK